MENEEQFKHLSARQAWALLEQKENRAILFDTRELEAFKASHPKGAVNLTQNNMHDFCGSLEFDSPIIFICYHGISSQNAAQYFVNYGFEKVYSIDGGFAAWQQAGLPIEVRF